MTEDPMKMLEDRIVEIEKLTSILREKMDSSVLPNVEAFQMDIRALNTSIQNAMLTFGALREKLDGLRGTFEYHIDSDVSRWDQLDELHRKSFDGFGKLCTLRCSALTTQTTVFREEFRQLLTSSRREVEELAKKQQTLEVRINNWLWVLLLSCLGYLANMLFGKVP